MADVQESLLAKGTTEDAPMEPQKYQSSALVVAATELNFEAKSKGPKDESKGPSFSETIKHAHKKTKQEVLADWNSNDKNGLSQAQVEAARNKYGWNELTPAYEHPWWVKLLLSIFGGFFNQLLWVGSLLCFISYGVKPEDPTNLYLGVVLSVVVTITGIFGYFQESKSADIMASFSKFRPKDTIVIRDGQEVNLEARELVPGDLVQIPNGCKVPADIRVIEQSQMKVDNASLTGESEPQERHWKPDDAETPIESKNLIFFGTLIVNGKGKGIIVATGDDTFMGQVAKLAQQTENVETPIAKEIKSFVTKISGIAFFLGALFFILGMIKNPDIVDNVIFLIGIIVANVPEGLLATVTVSLTLTANRMGAKNVQVKNLESVETLGSTSVICSDKTGTLTTSIMTVSHVFFNGNIVKADTTDPFNAIKEVDEDGSSKPGEFYVDDVHRDELKRLLRIGLLCNNAVQLKEKGEDGTERPVIDHLGNIKIIGDSTESAIYKFCAGHVKAMNPQWDTVSYRAGHPELHQIPFNSSNKWQLSLHKKIRGQFVCGAHEEDEKAWEQRAIGVLKGAPERVLNMCTSYLKDGQPQEMTPEDRKNFMASVLKLGAMGERVLAFADQELDPEEYDVMTPEPAINADPSASGQATDGCACVKYGDEYHNIEMNATDKQGNKKTFDDHSFGDLYKLAAEQLGLKQGELRLHLSQSSELLQEDMLFSDFNVTNSTVICALKGPFKFKGSTRQNANWPFGLNGQAGFTFVGLYAMIDPARPGVPEAVLKCQDAGIKVIMVTGDHPVTAHAIAKKVNIVGKDDTTGEHHMTKQDIAEADFGNRDRLEEVDITDPRYRAALVPGKTLEDKEMKLSKSDMVRYWNEVLTKESVVFARTSPEQKLKIVAACQERGGVVAVTGDGVNDSPALKKADIGVAMGITGTDVAKESADMILKDDNFASIVNGVEEGRIIFDNLKKSIAYTLSSNIPEIAPFLFYQILGIPLPLTTVMILLVDLGTDLAPAISLAHEGAEADIMERAPRDQHRDKLVTWSLVSFSYLQIGMLQFLAGFYAYFVVLFSYGLYPLDLVELDTYNLFNYMAGDYEEMRDAYWLFCVNPDSAISNTITNHASCSYIADPSVFTCFWQGTNGDSSPAVFDASGAVTSVTTCATDVVPKAADGMVLSSELATFKAWYDRDDDGWIEDTKAFVSKGIALAGTNQQSSCGGGAGTDETGKASWEDCASACFTAAVEGGGCQGFKWAAPDTCTIYATCQEEVMSESGEFYFVDQTVTRGTNTAQKFYDFQKLATDASYEAKAFGAYTEFMYTMMGQNDFLKTEGAYEQRTCYGKRPDGYKPGAKYTYSPGTDVPGSAEPEINCDAFVSAPTWAYWEAQNKPCTAVNYCFNIDLKGPEGNTALGQNSIYPMEMSTRSNALRQSNTAYFISIIVVQWADLMICKTRVRSLFEQGMTNVFMNYSIFFETVLGGLLVYIPTANVVTGTLPLKFVWWTPAVPFSVMIYLYDEIRKGYIRLKRQPGKDGTPAEGCWLERNTYW